MIKKLRKSFIITAMLSVLTVLAVIVAVMNIANYLNSDNEADQLLGLLAENGGSFYMKDSVPPSASGTEEPPAKPDGDIPPPDSNSDGSQDRKNFRSGGNPGRFNMTAETPYETRYFTVVLKANGDTVRIDTGKIAAVTTEDALGMARALSESGKTTGYEGSYKYLVTDTDEGTLFIFIDRTRSLKSVTDFLFISLLVAVGAAVAVFILVFVFSGVVVKPIAESYEKQKKFITNAGHELKTPLAVINSCNEVIELEQGETKWTRSIAAQTDKLSRLTQELVALARMDEGSTQLNIEEFPLSEAVNEILEPFGLMAEQKGLDFKTDIQPDITYKGDKNSIARLCSIMADNAMKYTPEDGYVRFRLSAKNKKIVFSSENTAGNVTQGSHPELFDRFHRGDSSHNGDIPGYGIGLSMAQSIVSAHGGKIEAVSKDGKSLTITVKM